jgi:hypothetical protein
MLSESHNELSGSELEALVDNMDYDLLTRVDELPSVGGQVAKDLRRSQYVSRIRKSQSLSRLVSAILQGDINAATIRINDFWSFIWQDSSECPSENPFGQLVTVSSEETKSSSISFVPMIWSQEIGADTVLLEKRSLDIILRLCALSVTIYNLEESSKSEDQSKTQTHQEAIQNISQQLRNALTSLQLIIEDPQSKFMKAFDDSIIPLLQPSWIRKASCLSRTIGTWGVIILSQIENLCLKDSKKKKGKKGKPTASSDSAPVMSLILEFKRFFGE